MANNKMSSLFSENPETNDLIYSEKVDKSEYEDTDNEEISSIKFGITSEELDAFSHGYNLEFFEKKNFKYKAKKLYSYIKNGEINCQLKVRNLMFTICLFIFCFVLFLLVTDSLADSKTAFDVENLAQTTQQREKQEIKKEEITVNLIKEEKEMMIKKEEQTGNGKQKSKQGPIDQNKNVQKIIHQKEQKIKEENPVTRLSDQQKGLENKKSKKELKDYIEKVLPVMAEPNKEEEQEIKNSVEKNKIENEKVKTGKDMKEPEVGVKEGEKIETMNKVKSESEVKISNPVHEEAKNTKKVNKKLGKK